MVDHKKAADKQIDSMTDKVAEREVAGSGAAVQHLQSDVAQQPTFLVPERTDLDLLQQQFGASRFQVIDCYTKAEGHFENTVRGLLRTF